MVALKSAFLLQEEDNLDEVYLVNYFKEIV